MKARSSQALSLCVSTLRCKSATFLHFRKLSCLFVGDRRAVPAGEGPERADVPVRPREEVPRLPHPRQGRPDNISSSGKNSSSSSSSSRSSTQRSARRAVDEMHVFQKKVFSPRPEASVQVYFNAKTHLLKLRCKKRKKTLA